MIDVGYESFDRIGRAIKSKANFAYSSLSEAVKESVESYGVPTKRSYWKEHPWHALLTTALVAAGFGTATCDLDVALDPNTYVPYGKIGQVQEDVSFIPPHRHSAPPSGNFDENLIHPRLLNARDILSFAAPVAFFALAIGVEKYNYDKWKKSIERIRVRSS